MIYNNPNFVFVHIPKTGGTSIYRFFKKNIIGTGVPKFFKRHLFNSYPENLYGWDMKHQLWKQHATMQQINNLYQKDYTNYFKFGFVRNPWERAVSDFNWFLGEKYKPEIQGSFTDYLLVRNGFEKIKIKQEKTYRYDHTIPQYDFLFDSNGNQLVDFIGKFENLQNDFNIVCNKIGIQQQQLPHFNKSKHKHYSEYYDKETRQIVEEKYCKDIEVFGYKFDG